MTEKLKVNDLIKFLLEHIDTYDDDSEVWFMSGENLSSPCTYVCKLNSNDVVFGTYLEDKKAILGH